MVVNARFQNEIKLRAGWYAVMLGRDLRKQPARAMLDGRAYVVWRREGGIGALRDVCPHRGAPLSQGCVRGGNVVCPYHGWTFDATGRCTDMPALEAPFTARADAIAATEAGGCIFLWVGTEAERQNAPPPAPPLMERPHRTYFWSTRVRTSVADIGENGLDTTHTPIVHPGILRKASASRLVQPDVQVGPDWIEATYPPAATPSGLAGRLMAGARYTIRDRFSAPSNMQVTYSAGEAGEKIPFVLRLYLTPAATGEVQACAVMAVAGRGPFSAVKLFVMSRLMTRIFKQDKVILNAVSDNLAGEPPRPIMVAPQDILRKGIDAILRGEPPQVPVHVPKMKV